MAARSHRFIVKYRKLGSVSDVFILHKSPRKVKKCLKRELGLPGKIDDFEWVKVVDTKKCTNLQEK